MSDYVCPNCRGGFPESEQNIRCPWCSQPIDGTYDLPRDVHVYTSVESDSDHESEPMAGPLYQKLFGWLSND